MQLMPVMLLSSSLLAAALPLVNRAAVAAAAHDSQITIVRSGSQARRSERPSTSPVR